MTCLFVVQRLAFLARKSIDGDWKAAKLRAVRTVPEAYLGTRTLYSCSVAVLNLLKCMNFETAMLVSGMPQIRQRRSLDSHSDIANVIVAKDHLAEKQRTILRNSRLGASLMCLKDRQNQSSEVSK